MIRFSRFPVATAILLAIFFTPVVQAKSGSDGVTAKDVEKEVQELASTLEGYTSTQREEAIEAADKAVKKLDRRIEKLESRVDKNWDEMAEQARQEVRDDLKALRQQRNELAEKYGSFKTSSAEAWEHMKNGFSEAYQSVSEAWQKVEAEYSAD